ncbi:TIGR04066 family peptide maturation system protein [Gorillibacterium sp. sgz500922]|uniref:TIGR04066 family peptide maturation system protein n=1 Tax=Gorillibacterium sp. sgz500922 TaxID=3446694 RepID=UPI003F66F814
MNYQAVVFPYSLESAPLLRHRTLLKEIEVRGLVSLKGWGLSGKDASYADGGKPLNRIVRHHFEEIGEEYNAVLFVESNPPVDIAKVILPQMVKTAEARKHVLSTVELPLDMEEQVMGVCAQNGVDYKSYADASSRMMTISAVDQSILKLDTPVIFVMGLSDRCNKFEIQLGLRESLLNEGYKVSQIGSRSYCECLGFHSMPGFMVEPGYMETEKIIRFNRYVKDLEKSEQPDVILIGIPGGVAMLNHKLPNYFGILAYEISQAVRPDAVILSAFYDAFTPEYFEKVRNLVRYRNGFEIDHFALANTRFQWDNAKIFEKEEYLTLSSDFIDAKIPSFREMGLSIFNSMNESDLREMYNRVIEDLEECSEIELV